MPLIIDTYNVLHTTGALPPDLAGIETADLIELIGRSRYRKEQACLVCDGTPPPGGAAATTERTHLIYAGAARSADDVIERMIDRSSGPKRLTIVSSDRRVVKAARRRRCRTLSSDAFLRQIARDHRRTPRRAQEGSRPYRSLSSSDVERWINAFGLTEADLAVPAGSNRPDLRPAKPGAPLSGDGIENLKRKFGPL